MNNNNYIKVYKVYKKKINNQSNIIFSMLYPLFRQQVHNRVTTGLAWLHLIIKQ